MTKRFLLPLMTGTALVLTACSSEPAEADQAAAEATAEPVASNTVVDVAVGNPDFSTLVAAVQAAGLAETLSGPGPFTVFAPANAAFAKLPEGTVETLTTTDTDTLGSILTYHVVAGQVNSSDLLAAIEGAGDAGYTITTVNGGTLNAKLVDGKVQLTDAAGGMSTVTMTDVAADNGVIHVIDTVLMPA